MRNRKRYPRRWHEIARACKEQAGWCCQQCGVAHGTLRLSWSGRLWPVYLQAAHVHHDPDNESPELACVCPRCHWRYYRKPGQKAQWMIEKIKHQILLAQARGHVC